LGATEEQLVRVEAAIAEREEVREQLFHEAEPVTSPDRP
jgi:hypothetical protein